MAINAVLIVLGIASIALAVYVRRSTAAYNAGMRWWPREFFAWGYLETRYYTPAFFFLAGLMCIGLVIYDVFF